MGSLRRTCPGGAKRRQRFECNDPWGDGGRKIFREKRAQRLVLPGLDIARRPVVEQAKAENMLFSTIDVDRFAEVVAWADENTDFEFIVHALAWTEAGLFGIWRLGLAKRSSDIAARHDDRRAAAMVTDWNPPVVRHQWIVWAEQTPNIDRMMDRRVEIRVVADPCRHLIFDLAHRDHAGAKQVLVVRICSQQSRQFEPQDGPGLATHRHEIIEHWLRAGTHRVGS